MAKMRILLVEDNDGDARLLEINLRKVPDAEFELVRAVDLESATQLSGQQRFDVILLDLSLPDSQGLDTIDRMHGKVPHSPIVVFTGREDDSLGMESLQHDAQDYLVKGQVDGRLCVRSMRYAIERKRMQMDLQAARNELEERVKQRTAELEQAIEVLGQEVSERRDAEQSLRATELQLRMMAEAMPEVVWIAAPDMSKIYFVNSSYERVWGRSRQSLYDSPSSWADALPPEDRERMQKAARDRLESGRCDSAIYEYTVIRPDGDARRVRARSFPICDEHGKLLSICGIADELVSGAKTAKTEARATARK